MKNRRWIMILSILLTLTALACNFTQPEPTPTPTAEPTSTPVPKPTSTPEPEPTATSEPEPTDEPEPTEATTAEGASIEITNTSGRDIWYIYISPTDAEEWGEDWLNDDIVFDGDVYLLTGIPEGVYDVQARDENDEAIQTFWGAEISGDMTWTVVAVATLDVVNESEDIIAELYVSPSASDSWGEDRLGGTALKAGGTFQVTDLDYDSYDAKVLDADGDLIEAVYNVTIDRDRTWTIYGKTDLPDNAVLRFEDDFSDNRNNWGASGEQNNVTYNPPTDGAYCIDINTDNMTAWEWYEPFRTDEFVAEVACNLDPIADASCGLGFGPDGDNLFWFEISPADQGFALFLLQDDQWQENLVDWTVSKNIYPHGWNYLSMQRMGGVISLYINGILVEVVETDLFPEGRLGIGGSTYDESNVTVCLDNLSVWRLE